MSSTNMNNKVMSEVTPSKTESVLFVDDEPRILSSIRRLVRPLGLTTYFAEGGKAGLAILEAHHIDLVVSDMRMPEMNGAEFLTEVKARWPKTVRMLLTGYADISSTIDALNNGGIYRYISKPWDDEELKEIISEGIKIRRLERETIELQALTKKQNDELQDLNKNLEQKVEARTEEIRQTSDMLDMAYHDLRESYDGFIRVFSDMITSREVLQKAQPQIVADFSRRMAKALKLSEQEIQDTYYAGLLHQLGKMGMPDSLLDKSEIQMSALETTSYQQYPLVGEAALTAISGLENTAQLIRSHTEYTDGSGYPDKLKGGSIKPGARIIRAVRDYIGLQTGLMNSHRVTAEKALEHIQQLAGKKYDRGVVKCLAHFRKDYDLSQFYADEIRVDSYALSAGMRLTQDLKNGAGLLLIAKGHILNEKIIEKVLSLEKLEKEKMVIYVAAERPPIEQMKEA